MSYDLFSYLLPFLTSPFRYSLSIRRTQQSMIHGNTIPHKIPLCRSFPNKADTFPAIVGPTPHPRSPASASNANISVPPFLSLAAERLKVPGQKIPTENPHSIQPISPAEHISSTLNDVKGEYSTVFTEYQSLNNTIRSYQ